MKPFRQLLPLEDRVMPVADLYVGVPSFTDIPAHAAYATSGTLVYVSPDGLNPDGATTGSEGTTTNPRQLTDAIDWATANAVGATLILRGGVYRSFSQNVDAKLTLQSYGTEKPWLNGAVVVNAWNSSVVGSATYWAMGTSNYDYDGAGPGTARSFEMPQDTDYHYVDITKNPFANNREGVFVTDGTAATNTLKQLGLYRKLASVSYNINVSGVSTPATYSYRRSSDNKLIDPAGVPATDFNGAAIDGGGTTAADWTTATTLASNLALLGVDNFFVDYVSHNLYLASDPATAGRSVEVVTGTYGLNITAADVTVRGLGFTRWGQNGLAGNGSTGRLRVEDCASTWNSRTGISVGAADTIVRNCRMVANGEGGGGGAGDRLLAEGNTISYNNVERYATFWNAAGWKVTSREFMVFRGNTFDGNFCTGLWMDINVRNAMVVNNTAINCTQAYFVEISDSNTVAFNTARACSVGLLISGASRTRVFNNTFVGCSSAVTIKDYDRVNDVNEDGGATGGGGAYDLDPYEGGEDDKSAAGGSSWDVNDNIVLNNLFDDTRSSTLFDLGATQENGSVQLNSRVTGLPYNSRTMLAQADFNGYYLADSVNDRYALWDPGTAKDVIINSTGTGTNTAYSYASFAGFQGAPYGYETHTATSGAQKLVYAGGAEPFLVDAVNGDLRLKAGSPAANRTALGTDIAAVPADILAAAGVPQPSYLGALPLANADVTSPAIGVFANQTISENAATSTLAFSISDAVTAAASLVVSAWSSNPVLVPLSGLALGGSGGNRTLIVTPAPDQSGTATLTLSVRDAAGNTSRSSFTLTVNTVNPRATISGGSTSRSTPTLGMLNTPLAIPLTLSDTNAGGGNDVNSVTLSARSYGTEFVPDSAIVFSGSGTNRTVTLTPIANTTGILSFEVFATDPDGAVTTRRIYADFRAADGNRAPRVGAILNQGLAVSGSATIEFHVGDLENPAGTGLTLAAVSSNPALIPSANIVLAGTGASRTVTLTAVSGLTGTAIVSLTPTDPQGRTGAPRTFTVQVGANATAVVNDAAVQRSRLTKVVLSFDRAVDASTLTALGAVTLTSGSTVVRTGATGANGRVLLSPAFGMTSQVTLTFDNANGAATTAGVEYGSLADGKWTLTIPSLGYTNASLRRLFGDVNGDGTVDGPNDFATFEFGPPGVFDYNGDGTVDGPTDFAQFGIRFGRTL